MVRKWQVERVVWLIVATATISSVFPPWTSAQTIDPTGETVRLGLTGDRRLQGVVLKWDSRAIELRASDGAIRELDWGDVLAAERYRLRRNTVRGLWIGALAGGVVAGIHAGATWEPCTALCFGPDDRAGTIALATVLGGAAGGLTGMLVGALVKTSTWEPLAVPFASESTGSIASVRIGVRWSP